MGGGFSQFAIAATAFEIVESLADRGVVEQLGQLLINRIDGLGLHDCHTWIVQALRPAVVSTVTGACPKPFRVAAEATSTTLHSEASSGLPCAACDC